MKHLSRKPYTSKKAPLWQWLLIIVIVIALPLFFSFVRNIQIQNALMNSAPENQKMQQGSENSNAKKLYNKHS